jgi:hypothetical protein
MRVATVIAAVMLVTSAIVAGQAPAKVGIAGISGVVNVNPKADLKAAGFPPPYWAYPANLPDYVAPPDKGAPQHVPDSNVGLTLTQIRDLFTPPDWHPEDHPAMPPIRSGRAAIAICRPAGASRRTPTSRTCPRRTSCSRSPISRAVRVAARRTPRFRTPEWSPQSSRPPTLK